jgi:hypothetical protein
LKSSVYAKVKTGLIAKNEENDQNGDRQKYADFAPDSVDPRGTRAFCSRPSRKPDNPVPADPGVVNCR